MLAELKREQADSLGDSQEIDVVLLLLYLVLVVFDRVIVVVRALEASERGGSLPLPLTALSK